MNDRTLGRGLPRKRTARHVAAVFGATLAGLMGVTATASAAVLPATPANLGGVLGGAQPGDVIELAAGDYGGFTGAAKPGLVTIRPAPGASVTMNLDFASASNIRVEGVSIRGATLRGTTHDVTIAGSRFTGMAVVRAEQMSNANIVFDRNTHANVNVCSNCYEGRLQVAGQGPASSGVTVMNSVFGPGGNADGMQIGANGVRVLNNEFVGIRVTGAVHSDALQLYGQSNTVVRGNYFHDNDVAIMAPDGGLREDISDNVFVGGGSYRPAVQLGSHDATVFAHNTVRNLDVFLDAKSGDSPSSGSVARDNVFVDAALIVPSSKCSGCTVTHNLFSRNGTGANAIVGMPAFTGGGNPATYIGHLLAAGSPGKGNASDGTDRGIRVAPGPAVPQPGPAGQQGGAPQGTRALVARMRLKSPRRIKWSRLRRGVRVRITVDEPVRLVLRLSRKHSGKVLARKVRRMDAGRKTFVLRVRSRRRSTRKLVLMVRVTNEAGEQSVLRRTIRVRKRR
jgi:hypothetical protein